MYASESGHDAVHCAQRVELVGEPLAVGGGEFGQFQAGAGCASSAPHVSTSSFATSSAPILSSLSISRSTPLDVGQASPR